MASKSKKQKLAFDGKTIAQIEQEKQQDYIGNKKEELFDHLEPDQVRSNFRYSFGGLLRGFIAFFIILAVVVGGMYLYDYLKVLF